MNCVELQNSLAEVEDGSTAEQRSHLRVCPACSALVKELNLIATAAGQLRAADEPSPRVWNSIEIALRQEGLIRPRRGATVFPAFSAQWATIRWLAPTAAILLLALGIYLRQHPPNTIAEQPVMAKPAATYSDLNDEDLLQEIANNSPAMKTQFEENLRQVNQSIRDAQGWVDESPYDAEAGRLLMNAYQQKSMLFEMAMDRPVQ